MEPGRRLGHYEIIGAIGTGGMGEVYRARDTRLGRDVAVKVLPESVADDPPRRARFDREARLLATLSHPHIATIYGVEHAGTQLALVLELVEGPTLADRLATGPLPLEETLAIARQIADALDAAHERLIVHRDLKPQNVKLTRAGAVKLLDFGIAKALTGDNDLGQAPTVTAGTRDGTLLGTAAYMSPEQARGQPVDKRADIWAFGCVLYEMLTGRIAFPGSTLSDTLVSVLERQPDWTAMPASTPPHVRLLLHRTLEKDPRRRLRDIADTVVDLVPDRTSETQPVPAGPVRGRARPWTQIAAAFGLGALATLLLTFGWSRPTPPASNSAAPVSFTMAPPDGLMFGSLVNDVETTYVAISPDGSQLAFVAIERGGVGGAALGAGASRGSSSSTSAIWLRRLASPQPRRLSGTDGAISAFWSPDGRSLAFFARDKLQRLELPDGVPVPIADVPTQVGLTGTWGQGRILFGSVVANQIYSVSPAGGVPATVVQREESRGEFRLYWPRFLPDGQRALYLARRADGTGDLRLLEPSSASRSIVRVASNAEYVDPGYLVFVRDSTLLAQPFDLRTATISGQPVAIAESIDYAFYPTRAAFSASQSGTIVYQGHRNSSRLTWIDGAGKTIGSIGRSGEYGFMRMSPDATRVGIAVRDPRTAIQDIWTIDLKRGAMMQRLTSDPRPEVPGPWLPAGRGVLFGAARTGPPQLHYKDFGSGEERALLPVGDFSGATDVTPDGTQAIIMRRPPDGSWDLQILRLDANGAAAPLIVSAFNEVDGRLSPDGQLLAFVSDESKQSNVYVTTFPPTNRPVQISVDGGSSPRWSSDGGELFYLSADRDLMAVRIRRSPRLDPGQPRALFSTGPRGWLDFDVAPDGRFLAHVPETIAREQPLTIIVNWPAAVTR